MRAWFVGLALLIPAVGHAAPEVVTGRYLCDRGVEIPSTTVTTADGGVVVLHVEGRQMTLFSEPAASGVRYGWPSGGSHYVWWTKGDTATLYWKTPESEAMLTACALKG